MKQWNLIVDVANCTNCNLCVLAVQDEYVGNEFPGYAAEMPKHGHKWIDIKQKVRGQAPIVDAAYLPVMCQHCDDAPCEPVCPVFATYHNESGMNVQVYNRCIGTRFCANGCIYSARYFNFWEPEWPEPLDYQLNPDVTVRSKGIIEKCTFCVQRITRAKTEAAQTLSLIHISEPTRRYAISYAVLWM